MKKVMYVLLGIVVLFFSIPVIEAVDEGITVKVGEGSIILSGYAHTRYSYTAYDVPDTLSIVRARLILSGTVVPDVAYRFQYDIRVNSLRDVLVKYSGLPGAMAVSVGQFKMPISDAGLVWATPANNLITGPVIYEGYVYRSTGYTTVTFNDREIGIVLDGKMFENTIGYALGVVNGNGINVADDNNNKDVLGRVTLSPFKELNLGVGAMSGGEASSTYKVRTRWIGTTKYEIDNFKLIGEYFYQTREKSSGKLETSNWYVTISNVFKFNDQFIEPILRYQQYVGADTTKSKDRVNVLTPGLNFGLNKYTKLQINYNYIQDEIGANDNEILVQLELKF